VGARLVEHILRRRAAELNASLRCDRAPQKEERELEGHGEVWRGLLYVAGIRAPDGDILGALALLTAKRSRRGVPRQRVGRGLRRRRPSEDVYSGDRRRLPGVEP